MASASACTLQCQGPFRSGKHQEVVRNQRHKFAVNQRTHGWDGQGGRGKRWLLCRSSSVQAETRQSLEAIVQKQGELLQQLSMRVEAVESSYRQMQVLVEELKEGVCRPDEEEEDDENESSWTKEQRAAKIKILAQIKADEVVESAQLVTREVLGDHARAAVSNGKITMAGGVEIMQAGLVASGMDLEPLHVVADAYADLPPGKDRKFAILPEHVDLILSRAQNLKTALGTKQVLPVVLGQSIHPDASALAASKGVHVILRNQDVDSAVW